MYRAGDILTSTVDPTDVSRPSYFHKVVDCQWACPAHTNVPEYIRLIAQGRYTDAYMVNRDSNVFPGDVKTPRILPTRPISCRGASCAVASMLIPPLYERFYCVPPVSVFVSSSVSPRDSRSVPFARSRSTSALL